jgi:putative transposase
MNPTFTAENVKVAFETRYHFGWYAHGRQARFDRIETTLDSAFQEVTQRHDYRVLEYDIQPQVVRAVLSLTPATSPAEVTRSIKGNLAAAVRKECDLRDLWSRGWFVRSVGHVTNDVVRHYVAQQHDDRESLPMARHRDLGDPSALRVSQHGKFECNLHVVFVTERRQEFLDVEVAEALVAYWRQVCEKKRWLAWNIEVVWNHAHLFLGVSPNESPNDVAMSLLNNAEYFLSRRYAALRREVERTVWQPGYYVGTVGSATTAQVKAYLSNASVCDKVEGETPPR